MENAMTPQLLEEKRRDVENMAVALKESLSDIDGIECFCEALDYARDVGLGAKVTIDDREYRHAERVTDISIDYAPLFRGWHAALLERLGMPKAKNLWAD